MLRPLALAVALTAGLATSAQAATSFAYISSPNDGLISQYRLDDTTGAIELVEQTQAGDKVNPMALSPDGMLLFAAQRVKPYQVITYRIDAGSGHLERQGEAPLADSMAYLSTDRSGRFLMAASYGGALVSVQPIGENGKVSEKTYTYKTGPFAHSIRSDLSDRFVYVGNLGPDKVLQYSQDKKTGELTPIGEGYASTAPKTGPRHIAFSPNGKFLYAVGELSGTVTGFAIDPKTGALKQVAEADGIPQTLGLAHGEARSAANNDLKDDPTPRIWAADIRMAPDGRLLYITERTTSSVSAFKVEPDSGRLSFLGNYPVEEKQPRNIAFFPNGKWLLVTGEKSKTVGTYAVGEKGQIKRVSEARSGDGALWIEILQPKP